MIVNVLEIQDPRPKCTGLEDFLWVRAAEGMERLPGPSIEVLSTLAVYGAKNGKNGVLAPHTAFGPSFCILCGPRRVY